MLTSLLTLAIAAMKQQGTTLRRAVRRPDHVPASCPCLGETLVNVRVQDKLAAVRNAGVQAAVIDWPPMARLEGRARARESAAFPAAPSS